MALWLLACLAVVGNLGVFIERQFLKKSSFPSSLLVKNLCCSDLLMGVYLLVIGAADARLRGEYVAREAEWKASSTCTAAGFLSFLSSEVSAFTLCLVTLDRVLVICFPFKQGLHLTPRSALLLCGLAWLAGLAFALAPLLAGMDFYGQTGIGIPLPITRQEYGGQDFAFAVFILLNLILNLFVCAGQLMIYVTIRRTSAAAGSKNQDRDRVIARRPFLIVLTDFLCWFPIGLMGVLAKAGIPIPAIVNVWAAVFVLPLNSALNPFLYTLNSVLERWRAAREERRRGQTLARVQRELGAWPARDVTQLVRMCLAPRVDRDFLATVIVRAGLTAAEGAELAMPEGRRAGKNATLRRSSESVKTKLSCTGSIPPINVSEVD